MTRRAILFFFSRDFWLRRLPSQEKKTSSRLSKSGFATSEREVSPADDKHPFARRCPALHSSCGISRRQKNRWVEELATRTARIRQLLIFTTHDRLENSLRLQELSSESDIAGPPTAAARLLSDAAKPVNLQLYLQSAPGQLAKRLTQCERFLASPIFPDGKNHAVLFYGKRHARRRTARRRNPETGEIGRLFEQRLALIDIATGKSRQVSPPTLCLEYDGRRTSPPCRHLRVGMRQQLVISELSILDAASGLDESSTTCAPDNFRRGR